MYGKNLTILHNTEKANVKLTLKIHQRTYKEDLSKFVPYS